MKNKQELLTLIEELKYHFYDKFKRAIIISGLEKFKDDKDVILASAKVDPDLLQYASEEIKKDREIILEAIKTNLEKAYKYIPKECHSDRDFALSAIKSAAICITNHDLINSFNQFSKYLEDYNDDKEIVMEFVKTKGDKLKYVSDRLKDDKDVVMAAVEQDGFAIKYASEKLKNDKEIILIASKTFSVLQFVCEDLQNDRNFVLQVVRNGHNLGIKDKFKKDRDIVLAAVKNEGFNILDAAEELRDDKEIMITAILNAPTDKTTFILSLASDRLKDDKDVVMTAVRREGSSLEFASERLRDNKELVSIAIKNGLEVLQYASDRLRDDEDIVLLAIETDSKDIVEYYCLNNMSFDYASKRLKDDREFILKIIKINPCALEHASERLKDDKAILEEAAKELAIRPNLLQYAMHRAKYNSTLELLLNLNVFH